MQFAVGYLTGVLVMVIGLGLDLPWWACILLGAIAYGFSSRAADKLQEIRDRK